MHEKYAKGCEKWLAITELLLYSPFVFLIELYAERLNSKERVNG